MTTTGPGSDVDVEAIRARYSAERDRRRRPLGTDQYRYTEGVFAAFDRDPHAGPAPVIGRALGTRRRHTAVARSTRPIAA